MRRKESTLKNQRQKKKIITKLPKARENAGDQEWREIFLTNHRANKAKPMQPRISFDSQLKIAALMVPSYWLILWYVSIQVKLLINWRLPKVVKQPKHFFFFRSSIFSYSVIGNLV